MDRIIQKNLKFILYLWLISQSHIFSQNRWRYTYTYVEFQLLYTVHYRIDSFTFYHIAVLLLVIFFVFLSSVSSNQCMLLFHIEFAGQLLINKCKIVLINKIIRAHVHWVLRLYYRAWETHLNRNSLQLATYNTHVRCTQYRWVCISIRLVIS